MRAIEQSAEHHFVATLADIKDKPDNWMVLYLELSRNFSFENGLKDAVGYYESINAFRDQSQALVNEITEMAEPVDQGFLYLFRDGDIIILAQNKNDEKANEVLRNIYDFASNKTEDNNICNFNPVSGSIYHYQKLAEQKFLVDKRLKAFEILTDESQVASIAERRKMRKEPLIMVVEDDRFTASYASGILSSTYDMVVCRDGEEAVEEYIRRAPDIMFLDIHLPGMNGHEVLRTVKAADPSACVVMLSVDTSSESIRNCAKTGASGFIKKPFSKDRILNTVKASPHIRGVADINMATVTSSKQ